MHAAVSGELYVVPPQEFYDQGSVLWKLKKALYGLRTAPRAWQDHLAELLHTHNFKRMQPEANVYVNLALQVTILVYVDDWVICGNKKAITEIMTTRSKSLLLKRTGDLATDGVSTEFIGRTFTRQGDVVYIKNSDNCLSDIFRTYNLTTCKAATTATGMSAHSSKTTAM